MSKDCRLGQLGAGMRVQSWPESIADVDGTFSVQGEQAAQCSHRRKLVEATGCTTIGVQEASAKERLLVYNDLTLFAIHSVGKVLILLHRTQWYPEIWHVG